LSEGVAKCGLIGVVTAVGRTSAALTPFAAAYIVAVYWFTASTSFANPAVTIARGFSDTFAGNRPADVGAFLLAQGLVQHVARMVMANTARLDGHRSSCEGERGDQRRIALPPTWCSNSAAVAAPGRPSRA
jgi:hypothetical protein